MVTLYVGNTPLGITEAELRVFFGEFGEVVRVPHVSDGVDGQSQSFCFVDLVEWPGGGTVERLRGVKLRGRKLEVIESSSVRWVETPSRHVGKW